MMNGSYGQGSSLNYHDLIELHLVVYRVSICNCVCIRPIRLLSSALTLAHSIERSKYVTTSTSTL